MKLGTYTLILSLLSLLVLAHVRADARIMVHDFYGPAAARVHKDVVSLLQAQTGLTIVPSQELDNRAQQLGVDRFSAEGRKALARELQLSAWMTGMVQRRSGKLTLTVVVYDGAQQARVARARFVGSNAAKLSAAVKGRLWQKAGQALLQTMPPQAPIEPSVSEPEPQPDLVLSQAEVDRASPEPAANDDAAQRGEALRIFAGMGSPFRSLAYRDAVTPALGDYQLSGAPLADLYAELHPARFVTDGWLSWFGIEARAQFALSAPTLRYGNGEFKSSYDAIFAGMRARVPLGLHHVSVFSGYSVSRFGLRALDAAREAPAPSVDYRTIRSGVGGELALSDTLRVGIDAAWLHFLSAGDIASWFPRTTVVGFELALSGTFRMLGDVYARATAVYSRAVFDFHAQPDDRFVAGGALDQTLALALGLGVQL